MMSSEELKREAFKLNRKAKAVEWLDSLRTHHTVTCPADDMTGYPAPCSCGAEEKNRLYDFIKLCVISH